MTRSGAGAVSGLLAGSASWGVFWGGWAALLPGVKEQAGVSTAALGMALFAIPVGALPAMLGMGRVFDRYGRPAFGVALGVFAVVAALPGIASGVWALAGSLLLVGAASGAIEVGLNAAAAAEEAASGRRLFNAVHAATPVAMIVTAPLAGAARQFGATPAAVLLVVAMIVAASAVPNLATAGQRRASPTSNGVPASSGSPASGNSSRGRFVFSLRPVLYGLAGALVLFMENAVEQWSAVLLDVELGATAFVASLGPAGYMAALAIGRAAAQRYGTGLTPRRAVALAGCSGVVGLGLAAVSHQPLLALSGFALAGLGIAPALPTLLAASGRRAEPRQRGAAVSTVTTVSYLGFMASPASVGAAAFVVGLPTALGFVAAVGAVLAVCCALGPATLSTRLRWSRVRTAGQPASPAEHFDQR